jgi:dipeptide/tripeptide permease
MGKGTGYFTNYPKHVFLILTNEFCERFSYYGMKAILVLFLTNALNFADDTATAIYHAFNVVCYFMPIFGAMISDGWLGKFRTILYVSMIYGLGNIVMTLSAIPFDGDFLVWLPFIGLTLIALGTGGIKPCVSAFGGDQFTPDQQRQKSSFFSLFYMSINVGSLLSTILTPLIRSNVFCFGESCYAVAFGIPAALMITSVGIFAIGSPWYTKIPAGDNVLGRLFGCVWLGIKGKCCCCCSSKQEKKDHWLDYGDDKYGKQFVADVKDLMRVLWLFLPLPVFWALFDQQGSRWTLQATQMNGDFGSFVMQPDMVQVCNPLFVVILVPILESMIYPCLDKLHIPNTPLQRMVWGMLFAAIAFLLAGFLQIAVDDSAPKVAGDMESQVFFLNNAPCNVSIRSPDQKVPDISLVPLSDSGYQYVSLADSTTKNLTFTVTPDGCGQPFNLTETYEERSGYTIFVGSTLAATYRVKQDEARLSPTPQQSSQFRFLSDLANPVTIVLKANKGQQDDVPFFDVQPGNVTHYEELTFAKFHMTINDSLQSLEVKDAIVSKNGPVYTVVLTGNLTSPATLDIKLVTEIGPRTVNVFLQVPQYFVITLGECLFSVTGLSFAYSQAPPTMKSILTAFWLLNDAIGNVVVIIVAETGSAMSQMAEFFMFSGLMFVTTALFIVMTLFYEYVEPRDVRELADHDNKSINRHSSGSGHSNSHSDGKVIIVSKVGDGDDSLSSSERKKHNKDERRDHTENAYDNVGLDADRLSVSEVKVRKVTKSRSSSSSSSRSVELSSF